MHVKSLFCSLVVAACVTISGCDLGTGSGSTGPTREDAWRFLSQASFGPSEQSIQDVMAQGYGNWIDSQFAQGARIGFRDFAAARQADLQADKPGVSGVRIAYDQVLESFYTRALSDPSQLRARVVFALSEIFVVSFVNETLATRAPELVATYLDTLESGLDGNYRQLLEKVAKSPAMGEFLTYKGNSKEDPSVGRQPDENFAREVMQLFSIGLYQLNPDGTQKLGANGQPIPTYTTADIKGLAKVFTGWGFYRGSAYASQSEVSCFMWFTNCRDPEGYNRPMMAYPNFHSVSAKTFLGVTIPAQSTPSPEDSLKVALDTLASHPNVAPFFSKQLIQRLVTSNPSPEYVARVAASFTSSGGDIKTTVKAVLMDDEARSSIYRLSSKSGKLREPVLRMTALLRAFKFASPTLSTDGTGTVNGRTSYVSLGVTTDPATSLSQTPLFSPSVFNFFRPGYTPPNPGSGAPVDHVSPEMQLVSESSVTGYANYVQDFLLNGGGPWVTTKAGTQLDIQFDFSEQRPLAYDSATLTQHIADRLFGGGISDDLRALMVSTLDSIVVPAPSADGSNGQAINNALDTRVRAAILLAAVSPEFLLIK